MKGSILLLIERLCSCVSYQLDYRSRETFSPAEGTSYVKNLDSVHTGSILPATTASDGPVGYAAINRMETGHDEHSPESEPRHKSTYAGGIFRRPSTPVGIRVDSHVDGLRTSAEPTEFRMMRAVMTADKGMHEGQPANQSLLNSAKKVDDTNSRVVFTRDTQPQSDRELSELNGDTENKRTPAITFGMQATTSGNANIHGKEVSVSEHDESEQNAVQYETDTTSEKNYLSTDHGTRLQREESLLSPVERKENPARYAVAPFVGETGLRKANINSFVRDTEVRGITIDLEPGNFTRDLRAAACGWNSYGCLGNFERNLIRGIREFLYKTPPGVIYEEFKLLQERLYNELVRGLTPYLVDTIIHDPLLELGSEIMDNINNVMTLRTPPLAYGEELLNALAKNIINPIAGIPTDSRYQRFADHTARRDARLCRLTGNLLPICTDTTDFTRYSGSDQFDTLVSEEFRSTLQLTLESSGGAFSAYIIAGASRSCALQLGCSVPPGFQASDFDGVYFEVSESRFVKSQGTVMIMELNGKIPYAARGPILSNNTLVIAADVVLYPDICGSVEACMNQQMPILFYETIDDKLPVYDKSFSGSSVMGWVLAVATSNTNQCNGPFDFERRMCSTPLVLQMYYIQP